LDKLNCQGKWQESGPDSPVLEGMEGLAGRVWQATGTGLLATTPLSA